MNPNLTRRNFVSGSALLAGAAALPGILRGQNAASDAPVAKEYRFDEADQPVWTRAPLAPGEPGRDYRPTVTLNGSTLPYRVVDGVKVFHLTCEEVDHVFVPRTSDNGELRALCWGFNGQVHGPTIECVEGDRVRIYVTNKLPEATSLHWH
ncbi:MAG TPA: multicopper oxidase domain-containing protein, partial [Chthoniobacterales bacterium]|nr:multicopper oxidase domain-containing protein [Chthoniobacterales bacterium]